MPERRFREIPLDKWQWSPSPLPGQVVLVTSRDADGRVDVAPKSWVSVVAFTGLRLGFGCTWAHRTARNVRDTGEFALNIPDASQATAAWALADATDRLAGWTVRPGTTIGVPVLAECFAHIECVLDRMVEFDDDEVFVIGATRRIAVDERLMTSGNVSGRYAAARPLFFLEDGWYAPLGDARPVSAGDAG